MVDKKGGKAGEGDTQDRIIELLEEMVKWTRFSSMPGVKQVLMDVLNDDERKMVYQFSDGRGSEEVAKLTGVGASTIPRWWKIWIKAGISEAVSVKGGERAKRLFSLEDFGIDIPKPKQAIVSEKPAIVQSPPTSDGTMEENKDE